VNNDTIDKVFCCFLAIGGFVLLNLVAALWVGIAHTLGWL
jgi:hypothetical protein